MARIAVARSVPGLVRAVAIVCPVPVDFVILFMPGVRAGTLPSTVGLLRLQQALFCGRGLTAALHASTWKYLPSIQCPQAVFQMYPDVILNDLIFVSSGTASLPWALRPSV